MGLIEIMWEKLPRYLENIWAGFGGLHHLSLLLLTLTLCRRKEEKGKCGFVPFIQRVLMCNPCNIASVGPLQEAIHP